MSSILSSLLTGLRQQTPFSSPTDKVFKTTDFETVLTRGDANHDGHLSSTELNNLITSDGRYIDVDYDAAKIMQSNFAALANNAYKTGEPQLGRVFIPSDATIEVSDIKKLAGFDGDATNITKADVNLLRNGNSVNWPQITLPPAPSDNTAQLKQLVQFLLLLLLFSGGLFGRR